MHGKKSVVDLTVFLASSLVMASLTVSVGTLWHNANAQNVAKTIGTPGSGDGQLDGPRGIVVDLKGDIYVVDTDNNRIQEFDSNGKFITKWGSAGSGDGQFNSPIGITLDYARGYVYVTDSGNNRVEKFTANGTFITKWGSAGSGNGQFNTP